MKILAVKLLMLFVLCLIIQLVNSDLLIGREEIPQNQLWVKQNKNSNVWSPLEDNSNLVTASDKYSDNNHAVDDGYKNEALKTKHNMFPRILPRPWLRDFGNISPFLLPRPHFAVQPHTHVANKRPTFGNQQNQNRESSLPENYEEYRSSDGNDRDPESDPSENEGIYNSKKSGKLSINGALLSLADMLSVESQRRDQQALMKLRQRLLVAGKR